MQTDAQNSVVCAPWRSTLLEWAAYCDHRIAGSPAPLKIFYPTKALTAQPLYVLAVLGLAWAGSRVQEQASARKVFHVTLANWWLLDTACQFGASKFCFCSEKRAGGSYILCPPLSFLGALISTHLYPCTGPGVVPLRYHLPHGLLSAPQNSPVLLEADSCPPSQYFKLILQAMKIIHCRVGQIGEIHTLFLLWPREY